MEELKRKQIGIAPKQETNIARRERQIKSNTY